MIESWAAPLVTGAALVFLGVTGAMGVWYSLRIAWWILGAVGRGLWWAVCLVGDTACDIDQRRRDRESARRWRDQHALGWNSGVGLERLRAEAEALRPREVGPLAASVSGYTMEQAGRTLAIAGRAASVTITRPACDCEPDEFEARTFGGSVIAHHAEHQPECASRG